MSKPDFTEYKLKDISSFEYGKMPDKQKMVSKGYPVYSGYRIVGYYPEYMYEREKLLIIARGVGGTGDVKVSPPFSHVTNLSIVFNEKEDIVDYKYLYYYLSNMNMKRLDTGSCQSQITINQLEEYKVKLPDKKIQTEISRFLSTIENKIELNNRINAELEATAKTLYNFWFVQFDFPNSKGKPYKSSGGKMEYNKELKREIPRGWSVKKMADWVVADKNGDWGKEEPEGNFIQKVTCIRGTDINSLNGLEVSNPPIRYILEKNSFKILTSHDLIIEISGGALPNLLAGWHS